VDDQKLDSKSIDTALQNPVGDIPAQDGETQPSPTFSDNRQRYTQNPKHTQITRDPSSTTGYFRMLLAALPARYAFRGFIDSLRNIDTVSWPKKTVDAEWDVIKEGVENPLSPEKKEAAIQTFRKHGMPHNSDQMFEVGLEAQESVKDQGKFKRDMKARIKTTALDTTYDNFLGAGSLAVTASYEKRVYDDIKDIFSEAVAYEKNGNPDAITFGDLRHSDNKLVSSTVSNFISKTQVRLGTDLGFFGRQLSRLHPKLKVLNSMRFGDMMIGVKGGLLINEVLKKDTTIFTDLLSLIDNKVNPEKGLGESITSADVIDLYQKYARLHNPEAAFTDTTIYQQRDQMEWPQAEQVFLRVSDLMNQTYMYKHSSLDDMARLESVTSPSVDFALPKLIYLLGHDMIDARKPEESYAYVEIAGKSGLGIEAVKEAKHMIDSGTSVDNVAKQFGIDLTPVEILRGKDGTDHTYKELKEERIKARINPPASSILADGAQHEFLEELGITR